MAPENAAVVVGLLAAAMSTADSQLFALGAELRSLLSGSEMRLMLWTRLAIFAFALSALVFSILSSDQLVLLARTSFAGTSLLAPLVLSCVLRGASPRPFLVAVTASGILVYLASLLGVVPDRLGSIRTELATLGIIAAAAWISKPKTAE